MRDSALPCRHRLGSRLLDSSSKPLSLYTRPGTPTGHWELESSSLEVQACPARPVTAACSKHAQAGLTRASAQQNEGALAAVVGLIQAPQRHASALWALPGASFFAQPPRLLISDSVGALPWLKQLCESG